MKTFKVSRIIPASAERIWAVLTDSQKLSSGSLGITRIEGTIARENTLRLWTEATGERAFALKVTQFVPPQLMVWEGGMPLGLFRGVRRFSLAPGPGGVQFEMSESFSGPLAGLIVKSIPDLTPSFERFAQGLAALSVE
jgi:hypothetical protein